MNPETDLFERYPHLLNEQSDPETVALVEQLDTLYRSPELPARLTLAAVLAEREQEDEPRHWFAPSWAFRPIFWLPRRLGTVALALTLAVVLMAASAYAFTSFLRPGLQPPPGDQGISQVFKLHQLVEVPAGLGRVAGPGGGYSARAARQRGLGRGAGDDAACPAQHRTAHSTLTRAGLSLRGNPAE